MAPRRPTEPEPYLAIKESSSVASEPCVLCGQPTYPFAGPELFLAETWDLVCWDCGGHHAPMLVDILLDFWDVAGQVIEEEEQRKITPTA